jgi:hypothetical protein
MAVYKVIQDIEAEDKLVGPLTLKQFIYAGIAAICLYICFLGLDKHFPYILLIFLPVALLSGFFAYPWGRDQPTETWALAKVRFFFKPRMRIWDQSGTKELVTITAPKHVDNNYTNGLSQTEVKSRLRALADTIDSRGWAVKNVNINLYSQPLPMVTTSASDRLIDPTSLPQQVPNVDVSAADDIFAETANPVAQHFEQMIEATEQSHRQSLIQQVKAATQGSKTATPSNDYWFMNQPSSSTSQQKSGYTVFQNSQVVAPGSSEKDLPVGSAEATPEENALAQQIENQAAQPDPFSSHLRNIQPLSGGAVAPTKQVAPPVTPAPDPVILGLANNNDRSVDSIAREVNQARHKDLPTDEVIVPLH